MRQIVILVVAILPQVALGSESSGSPFGFAFNGIGEQETFSFAPSARISGKPPCNTTGTYSIARRSPGAYIAISLLLNLRNRDLWSGTATMRVSGSGDCSLAKNSEDLALLEIYEGSQLVFSFGRINKYAKIFADTVLLANRTEIDANHPPPPFIRDMSPRHRSRTLEPLIIRFQSDVCTLGMFEALEKWCTAGTKPNFLEKLTIKVGIPEGSGISGDALLWVAQRGGCALRKSLSTTGIHSFAETTKGDSATVIWRDDGRRFHGTALFRESGKWKIDLNNRL